MQKYFSAVRVKSPLLYTIKMINQDRMIFDDLSVNSKPISFLQILQRPFSIQILTALKIS